MKGVCQSLLTHPIYTIACFILKLETYSSDFLAAGLRPQGFLAAAFLGFASASHSVGLYFYSFLRKRSISLSLAASSSP